MSQKRGDSKRMSNSTDQWFAEGPDYDQQTLYQVLGVDPSATQQEITQAFRREIRQAHPDVSQEEGALERSKAITRAYAVLGDKSQRLEYDQALARQRVAEKGPATHHRAGSPVRWERQADTGQRTGVHGSRVLLWSVMFAATATIAGYVVGFRAAQPTLDPWTGAVGAIVVLVAAAVTAAVVLPRLPFRRIPWGALWSVEGNVRLTLLWSCVGIVVGSALGGVLGYAIGLRTAQAVYNALAVVGTIVIGIAIVAAVFMTSMKSKRRGRR